MRILGTSITCSGTWISCGAKASTNSCSSISGTGTSSIGAEMICSMVCQSRSCGLTSVSQSGREPPAAGASSPSRKKCCAPAAWGADRRRKVQLVLPPPALAVFWRCALWCVNVAREMRIDYCSCLSIERSLRSLRRRALPVPPPASSRPAITTSAR